MERWTVDNIPKTKTLGMQKIERRSVGVSNYLKAVGEHFFLGWDGGDYFLLDMMYDV